MTKSPIQSTFVIALENSHGESATKNLSSRNQSLFSFSIKTLELKKKIQNFQIKTINQGRNKKNKAENKRRSGKLL